MKIGKLPEPVLIRSYFMILLIELRTRNIEEDQDVLYFLQRM